MMLTRFFTTKQTGDSAERIAEKYLGEQGLKPVARNYRCRYGEIDLIMQERDVTVFVEVRLRQTRGDHDFGGAAASIGPRKQERLIAAAQHYLAGMKQLPRCRFDAVLLNQLTASRIEWIKDAFGA